jgi:phage gp45-like
MDLEARVAQLERLVARLSRQNGSAISFARSTMAPVDSGAVQTVQAQFDALTVRDAIPVVQQYGLASAMPAGGDKVVAHLGGQRSLAVAIATGHQAYRQRNQAVGEVTLYDMWGRNIRLTAAGVTINCGALPMTITGNLRVTGSVIAGYGGADQVGLQTHRHGTGTNAAGTVVPTAGL